MRNLSASERVLLPLILLAYAVLAVLYAVGTPAWQVPDEPAHYNYVRQVAEGGCCPVLTAEDWDADMLERLKASGFDPQLLGDLPAIQYEDHQPPLYYLLAAPVYALTGGSLTALRLFSAALGAGVVLCIYGIARLASGGVGVVALGAAAFAAFIPQHIAILAGAGNDSLAELIVGVGLLLAVWTVTPGAAGRPAALPAVGMGLVMGLGFLTKASTFLLAPVLLLALVLRWRREPDRRWGALLRAGALFAVPALALGILWWARNVGVYGWPDVMGLARHDAVVVGQPRTADWISREGLGAWLADGVATTFRSFWGQFGWMGVPMPGWVYLALLAFTVVSYAGLLPLARRARWRALPPARRDAILLLGAVYVLGIAQFVYYNTAFVQFQGRYLYPALAAFALVYAAGWHGWGGLLAERLRLPWLRWAPLLVMGGLAGLSGYALWRFVIPNLRAW